MKNNVIFVLIDSVTWECVGNGRAKVSPTPFLDSLKCESITTTKLYSHGPYTDAATKSLYTGRNCLDDFGYYFKTNESPITHYKMFHDAGYETYDFNYAFYVPNDRHRQYIDHSIYVSSFEYRSEWGGIYKYYSEIIQSRPLNEDELLLLKARVGQMFKSWINYFDDIKNKPESSLIHQKSYDGFDIDEAFATLKKEYCSFEKDEDAYIKDFLIQGLNHILANLDTTGQQAYIKGEYLNNIWKKYRSFFNKLRYNNLTVNFLNNIPSPKRVVRALIKYLKTKDSSNFLFLPNYFLSLSYFDLMKKRWSSPGWQEEHSCYLDFKTASEILKERKSDRAFYMFFHTEEVHNNIAFFTYDVQDDEVISEEIKVLKGYADSLGTDFRGSLMYLLSLRYVDYQIEKFCNNLKEMGLWDSTTLLICADHGSSYTGYPIHNQRVNNFDNESYHIPMLLRHPGFKGREISTYQMSKDVLPTLADIVGIPKSPYFKGESMLDDNRLIRPFVISEYMGPGCPDLTQRPIWFSARDEKYIVAYKVGIYQDFEDGDLAEVYDLNKDPNGYYNINDKIDKANIDYLLEPIKQRWAEIKMETYDFINKLKECNV